MTPERWQQITQVFHAALERDASSRRVFLDEACAADQDLRLEVAAMLKGHDEAGNFGDAAALTGSLTDATDHVADYHLLEKIGQGGMGEVWLAEQLQPVDGRWPLSSYDAEWTAAMLSRGLRRNARRWPGWIIQRSLRCSTAARQQAGSRIS